jgi:hypothetical protein
MGNAFDISDVRPDAGQDPNLSPTQLPIRGEKRIIPTPISPSDLNTEFQNAYKQTGKKLPTYVKPGLTGRTQMVQGSDFYAKEALSEYTDYVYIRLVGRGVGANQQPSTSNPPAVYRFLINPATVQVSRNTIDGQAMTRAGWQIGVWGEDAIQINLSGKTAGQYFALGLTDEFQPFTESYRNYEQLQMVFENNGYWFEGEQLGDGALSADFTRRRIKMHSDVELVVGNFIWYGMFDTMTTTQSADEPYHMNFQLSFVAWKERFRPGSPYNNLIINDVYRGHDFSVWESTGTAQQAGNPANTAANTASLPPNTPANLPASPFTEPTIAGGFMSPAQASANAQNTAPQVDGTALSQVPMANVLGYGSQSSEDMFNGVLNFGNIPGQGSGQ